MRHYGGIPRLQCLAVILLLVFLGASCATRTDLIGPNNPIHVPSPPPIRVKTTVNQDEQGTTIVGNDRTVVNYIGRGNSGTATRTTASGSIVLNPQVAGLTVGHTLPLTATVVTANGLNNRLVWLSGAPDIATVNDQGQVTGVAPGQAAITVASQDDLSLAVQAVINVQAAPDNDPRTVPVAFMTLLAPTNQLGAGAPLALSPILFLGDGSRSQEYTLTSTDPRVASVDAGGVVMGVALGQVVITMTTSRDPALKAEVTLLVTSGGAVKKATGVPVSPDTAILQVGATKVFTAYVVYEDGSIAAGVKWAVADRSKCVITGTGLLTAVDAGTCTITAAATQDDTVVGQATVTIPTVSVTGVSVVPASARIKVGQSVRLGALVKLSNGATETTASWSSGDQGVARVDDQGVVTGLQTGIVTISAAAARAGTQKGQATIYVDPAS